MEFTDEQLETAIRNADSAGNVQDVQALAVEYNRRKQASEQDRGLVEEASSLRTTLRISLTLE